MLRRGNRFPCPPASPVTSFRAAFGIRKSTKRGSKSSAYGRVAGRKNAQSLAFENILARGVLVGGQVNLQVAPPSLRNHDATGCEPQNHPQVSGFESTMDLEVATQADHKASYQECLSPPPVDLQAALQQFHLNHPHQLTASDTYSLICQQPGVVEHIAHSDNFYAYEDICTLAPEYVQKLSEHHAAELALQIQVAIVATIHAAYGGHNTTIPDPSLPPIDNYVNSSFGEYSYEGPGAPEATASTTSSRKIPEQSAAAVGINEEEEIEWDFLMDRIGFGLRTIVTTTQVLGSNPEDFF